jgi:predicted amidohydrolase
MKFAPTIAGNLAKIEQLLGEAARRRADAVLLPECATTGYYVFANSVGPQGAGMWSAGDSKIVGPDERVLGLADNCKEAVIVANLDLSKATGIYARRGLTNPPFLAPYWKRMVGVVKRQAAKSSLAYDLPAIVDANESRMPRAT